LEKRTDVIIIGGGAAGIMAAAAAADAGASVTIIEKNEKLGKKLYITGKGRCNVTNNSDIQNLLLHVVSNPKFLYSAFSALNSQKLMGFLESSGLKLQTERGNRVFPVSGKSSDVIKTFKSALEKRNVKIYYNTEVQRINTENGIFKSVDIQYLGGSGRKGTETLKADAVIIATGGVSYPSTGSTGDGYRFARDTGHIVKETSPSLVPVNIKEGFAKELQGLFLRNVELTLMD